MAPSRRKRGLGFGLKRREQCQQKVLLIIEATDIVAVMTESLSRVVYYLYILEESEEASRYEATLDSNKLGRLFSAFNEMIDEMHSGKLIEVGLVLRSAILFNKIKDMLKAEGLERVVGQTLLSRLERSFDDFITSSSGREIKQNLVRFEAKYLPHHIIDTLKENIHADPSILDTFGRRAFVCNVPDQKHSLQAGI